MNFADLKLPLPIERALKELRFDQPTPIQEAAIPRVLTGRDLVASAQTGTGKTAAFCVPMLKMLLEKPAKTALVLVPTRELATQVHAFWLGLSRFVPEIRGAILIGGASFPMQDKALSRSPRLLIATPGRLLDHLERKTKLLQSVGILVLDEADRMLDMGFAPQLNRILRYLPQERQTLLFSATWSKEMDQLGKKVLRNPDRVSVDPVSQAATTVAQFSLPVDSGAKKERLLDEINRSQGMILVFARTQSRTDRLARYLNSYGLEVGRLHGGRSQGQRNSALDAFKTGKSRILVATDLASRGIDVTGITHVINFDLPQVPEDYVHRIGRTGRAGTTGQALSFVAPEERLQWRAILKHLQTTGSELPQERREGVMHGKTEPSQPRKTEARARSERAPAAQGRAAPAPKRAEARTG